MGDEEKRFVMKLNGISRKMYVGAWEKVSQCICGIISRTELGDGKVEMVVGMRK